MKSTLKICLKRKILVCSEIGCALYLIHMLEGCQSSCYTITSCYLLCCSQKLIQIRYFDFQNMTKQLLTYHHGFKKANWITCKKVVLHITVCLIIGAMKHNCMKFYLKGFYQMLNDWRIQKNYLEKFRQNLQVPLSFFLTRLYCLLSC